MIVKLAEQPLEQARREVARLKPGESWASDHPLTYREFCELVDEDARVELVDGVIYMPPPPADEHEAVFIFLSALLKTYVDAREIGEIRGSRSAVRVDPFNRPQPDIVFVRRARRRIIRHLEIIQPPDLVMEIAWSSASRSRAVAKISRYERIRVPEIWYIDLPRKFARITHRTRTGKYVIGFEAHKGVIRSKVVPGFAIRAEWLWSKPAEFPSVYTIVQGLLAGRLPK